MQSRLAATMGLAALLAFCFAGQANATCCTYLGKCYDVSSPPPCNLPMASSGCCHPPASLAGPRLRDYDMDTLVADIEAGII